jgi:hypothetical protein
MQPNPPWADKIMYANWKQVATFAQKQNLPMPTPTLPPSRKISWKEFGCGKWGCAYPTEDPNIVCKLTADMSEAEATTGIAVLQSKPHMDGIVRYYGIMPLRGKRAAVDPNTGKSEKASSVTLIWREGAQCGASLPEQAEKAKGKRANDMNASWQLLYNSVVAADIGRQIHADARDPATLLRETNKLLPGARREALADQDDLLALMGTEYTDFDKKIAYGSGPQGLAYCLASFELICAAIIKVGILDHVAATLLALLRQGILLADVHHDNVCELTRSNGRYWVITDPGQAVFLGKRTSYKQMVKTTSWKGNRKLAANAGDTCAGCGGRNRSAGRYCRSCQVRLRSLLREARSRGYTIGDGAQDGWIFDRSGNVVAHDYPSLLAGLEQACCNETRPNGPNAHETLFKDVEVWVNTTSPNDDSKSITMYANGCVWRLFVQPCCLEDRRDNTYPRFVLQEYLADSDEVEAGLRRAKGLKVVGQTFDLPTKQTLAEWHDGYADSGRFDQIYEGDDVVDLANALESDMYRKGVTD